VRDEIRHTIRVVRDSVIAVVMVDKTVSAVLSVADRVTVAGEGWSGLQRNPTCCARARS
jgi:ABC-type branched-subunit amino acid transport system ATPase component